jgi:hypothetical protein
MFNIMYNTILSEIEAIYVILQVMKYLVLYSLHFHKYSDIISVTMV